MCTQYPFLQVAIQIASSILTGLVDCPCHERVSRLSLSLFVVIDVNHGDYRLAVRAILARVGFDEP